MAVHIPNIRLITQRQIRLAFSHNSQLLCDSRRCCLVVLSLHLRANVQIFTSGKKNSTIRKQFSEFPLDIPVCLVRAQVRLNPAIQRDTASRNPQASTSTKVYALVTTTIRLQLHHDSISLPLYSTIYDEKRLVHFPFPGISIFQVEGSTI